MSRWTRPTRTTWWALGIAAAVTTGTAAFLWSNYNLLPFGVPVRYVLGMPLIYQVKTMGLVMLPATVQLALLVVFGALLLLLLWRAVPVAAVGEGAADADGSRMRLAAEGIALLGAIWISVQALGAVRLVMLWNDGASGRGGFGRAYSWVTLVAIVASISIAMRTLKRVGKARQSTPPPVDPSVWRLRNLYVNPRDPALFAPTRTGRGWTLNFGRPLAIVLLAATLIIGIGGPYLFARYVLRAFVVFYKE